MASETTSLETSREAVQFPLTIIYNNFFFFFWKRRVEFVDTIEEVVWFNFKPLRNQLVNSTGLVDLRAVLGLVKGTN